MLNERIEQLICRYLDGDCSPEVLDELRAAMKADPAIVRLLFKRSVQFAELLDLLREQPASVRKPVVSSGETTGVRGSVVKWHRWLIPLAAAASLAIVAGLWLFQQQPAPSAALGLRVAEVQGSGFRVHGSGGKSVAGVVGMELKQGERVVVGQGGKVGLKYDGEATTIELLAATEAGFGTVKGAKRVTLAAGKLVCAVALQAKAFEIKTRHATARVVGTRFSLDATEPRTLLAVMEGKVELIQGEKMLEVEAGESAIAGDEGLTMAQPRGGIVWAWRAWGENEHNPAPVKMADGTLFSDIMDVAAGPSHSVAVDSAGVAWAWGMNNCGQLGDGTTTAQSNPARVRTADGIPFAGVTAVAVGQLHSVALKNDHTVWAWGSGFECGNTARQVVYPVRVAGVSDVMAIAACATHTLALKADRTVLEWGIMSAIQNRVPVLVRQRDGGVLSDVIAISAGANHSVALKRDGSVWTWGVNMSGALGDGGKTSGGSMVAVQVRVSDGSALSNVVAVAGGRDRTVALKSDNSIWVWGAFGRGPTSALNSAVQLQPASGAPVDAISAITEGTNPYDILVLTRDGMCLSLTIEATDTPDDTMSSLRFSAIRVGSITGASAISTQSGSSLVVAHGEGR